MNPSSAFLRLWKSGAGCFAWVAVAWAGNHPLARQRLRQIGWILPLLPLYRMTRYCFRFSGFLYAVADPGSWSFQDPVTQARAGPLDLWKRVVCTVFGTLESTEQATNDVVR